jgi:hypothetical protein
VRSTLPPPYVIDGRTYSAAELDDYASQRCATESPGEPLPPNKFTTDGCSAWRDGNDRGQSWRACCIKHDVTYWCGSGRRREADLTFRRCVADASTQGNARLMYTGVRVGGGRFAPFPWRFGYGRAWPHHAPPRSSVKESEPSPQTPPTRP